MKVYLAKFQIGDRVAYKIGHTKYFNSINRFQDRQYDVFDEISVLRDINIQHESAVTARLVASAVEATLQCVYPKNFRLEVHFHTEENYFNKLSGITEMFVLTEQQSEDMLVELFQRVATKLFWVMREKTNV
ncbi:hypothetical protein UFOVP395_26 [uncultured Caudovirales phage]|jgi:hypothetical protein|uniref:Uncharacterized protein n=1 Tax=uncultured Caudovirales phage TaxID=2100421 RepID=A0A6J5M156_9CAUD|nr:hypothetical protein UFOVP395_26 [uncultured Caudovirales phage]